MVLEEDDIIELAASLARLNRIHARGETPNYPDEALNSHQMSLITKVLANIDKTKNYKQYSLVERLYKRLSEMNTSS